MSATLIWLSVFGEEVGEEVGIKEGDIKDINIPNSFDGHKIAIAYSPNKGLIVYDKAVQPERTSEHYANIHIIPYNPENPIPPNVKAMIIVKDDYVVVVQEPIEIRGRDGGRYWIVHGSGVDTKIREKHGTVYLTSKEGPKEYTIGPNDQAFYIVGSQ